MTRVYLVRIMGESKRNYLRYKNISTERHFTSASMADCDSIQSTRKCRENALKIQKKKRNHRLDTAALHVENSNWLDNNLRLYKIKLQLQKRFMAAPSAKPIQF